ncbi:MAG: hypothetical protein PHU51_00695 [Candidatus Nanoarchaeia archaeon]|nr:hypothetical protein [Candidatus Nanoarchaeia archaeon]
MNKQILFDIFLFILPLPFMWFTHNELFISLLVLCLIITTFSIKYEKNEIYLLLLGIIAGIIAEIGGDYFNKVQYWEQGSFFGVPFWLPLLWGYGVVYFRRIGNWIVSLK